MQQQTITHNRRRGRRECRGLTTKTLQNITLNIEMF